MQTKNIQRTLIAVSLATASSFSSAATIPYGVFDNVESDDYTDIISTITSQSVIELAKVEKTKADKSYKKHKQGFTSGSWNYSGTETVDWLLIEYGKKVGLYQVTDNDTSGVWDIAELENYSSDYTSGKKAKRNRTNKVTISAFSNSVAYAEITSVPVPAAAWLLVSGLLGLVAIGKRKHTS